MIQLSLFFLFMTVIFLQVDKITAESFTDYGVSVGNYKVQSFGGSSGGDFFVDMEQTSDNGYVTVGYSYSSDGDLAGISKGGGYYTGAMIVKYDANGNLVWKKAFGGSSYDEFYSVIEADDGGYLVSGYTSSIDGDLYGQNYNIFGEAVIVKYNSSGDLQWIKMFGGSREDSFKSLQKTNDGGYIAAGYSDSIDGDLTGLNKSYIRDAILVKYDHDFRQQWVKSFGGTGVDEFFNIVQATDGGYVAVGDSNSSDAIIVKFDSAGTVNWKHSFGRGLNDEFRDVIQLNDGAFVVVGYSQSADPACMEPYKGYNDAVIMKYGNTGELLWSKVFGGRQYDYFNSITKTSDGGWIVTGNSSSNDNDMYTGSKYDAVQEGILVKYNYFGDVEWKWQIGNSISSLQDSSLQDSSFQETVVSPNGEFIIIGRAGKATFIKSNLIESSYLKLNKNDMTYLDAYYIPSSVASVNYTWKSSNTSIATINIFGLVDARQTGTTTIDLINERGQKIMTLPLIVTTPVEGVQLNKTNLDMTPGMVKNLVSIVTPSDAINTNVIWTSSNNNVATVNNSGQITAISNGTATVTATTLDGGFTSSAAVSVTTPVESITVDQNQTTFQSGQTRQFYVIVSPLTATNTNVTWSSSNPSVATVNDKGLVTTISNGSTTITATATDGGFTASSRITVIGVSLNSTALKLNSGSEFKLRFTVDPTTVSPTDVNFRSSDSSIVSVDNLGLLKAKSVGTADITAKITFNGLNVANTTKVTVPGIKLSVSRIKLNKNQSFKLVPSFYGISLSNTDLKWVTSNTKLATVNSSGKVTTKSFKGTVTITVSTVDGKYKSNSVIVIE